MLGAGILLGDLVDGEVRNINVRSQTGLERCADLAKLLPNNTAEEGVIFDLGRTTVLATFLTNTVFRIAEEARAEGISTLCIYRVSQTVHTCE